MLSAELAAVVARFLPDVDVHRLRVSPVPQGFSGAHVWKIETADAAYAFRQWPQPGLGFLRMQGLHRLLEHLATGGLPFVAVPLRSLAGETLISSGDRWCQLEPWLPGTADFHAHPGEQRLRSTMAALARWHRAAETFLPAAETRGWFGSVPSAPSPAVEERLAKLRQLTPPVLAHWRTLVRQTPDRDRRELGDDLLDMIRSQRDRAISQLESVQHTPFRLQPCLRDIWHDHVLFTGDDVTGLIDPSACRRENVATDLARLIGSLVDDDIPSWQLALDEYAKHRPLDLAEQALVTILDRSGVILSVVTWLEWLFVEYRAFPDPEPVQQRLHWLYRRLETLTARQAVW